MTGVVISHIDEAVACMKQSLVVEDLNVTGLERDSELVFRSDELNGVNRFSLCFGHSRNTGYMWAEGSASERTAGVEKAWAVPLEVVEQRTIEPTCRPPVESAYR